MFDQVSPALLQKVFPFTPFANLERYLPDISSAAQQVQTPRLLFVIALATIRAETESFVPCREQVSRFNTSPGGKPFDLYDLRTELGNRGAPDGERYRGRGYVQLTGRYNYEHFGKVTGLALLQQPDLAAESKPAATILLAFLGQKKDELLRLATLGDLAGARRLVNGGSHGIERFRDAFQAANLLIP